MPPPATFFDITVLPYSKLVTVAEFNVDDEIWFRFITTVDVVFGHWTSRPGGVNIFTNIYESDGSTLLLRRNSSTGGWFALVAGEYYIKLDKFPIGPIAADLTFEADVEPLDDIGFPEGSVFISDDTNDQLAGILLEPDGTISTFVSAIPTGEIGDALPNGYILVDDRFGKYGAPRTLALFNPNLTFNQTIVPPTVFVEFPRIFHSSTDFYVIDSNEGHLYKVTTAGVITFIATIPEILAGGVQMAGITPDAATVYFGIQDDTGNILKYVVATGITSVHHTVAGFVAGDLFAETFDANPGDLIVLPDGTYVTWWLDVSTSTHKIIHINAAGALINSYDFVNPADIVNHLAYASTTLSTHIKVWLFQTAGAKLTKIGDLNLSTGLFTSSFTLETFSSAVNLTTNDNTKFGVSSSCPMYTLFSGVTPPGMFKIPPPPGKKTDHDGTHDVAIPNPTFKTGLLP